MPARAARNFVAASVALCVVIGVVAGVGRAVYLGDFAARLEPARKPILDALGRRDPPGTDRRAILHTVDDRFAAHPKTTLLHVVPGALYLLLVPVQLSRGIRRRYPFVHRWNGRLALLVGLASVLASFYFGLGTPLGGVGEAIVIAIVGAFFAFALGRAFIAIRRKETALHREWMLRAFGAALGISVVRLVASVYDVALSPAGYSTPAIFVLSLWTGWAVSISTTEWWIRNTRTAATT